MPTLHTAPFPVKGVAEEVQSKWRDSQLQKLVGKWGARSRREKRGFILEITSLYVKDFQQTL